METSRLILVPCSLELAAALTDRAAAEKLLGATVPEGWPDDELAGLLELYVAWLRADPSVLGYGITQEYRNRGYATEAAPALVEWALAQPEVDRVIARSDRANHASSRVLEKTGMTPEGADGRNVRWVRAA